MNIKRAKKVFTPISTISTPTASELSTAEQQIKPDLNHLESLPESVRNSLGEEIKNYSEMRLSQAQHLKQITYETQSKILNSGY